jgi:hypothetical protein
MAADQAVADEIARRDDDVGVKRVDLADDPSDAFRRHVGPVHVHVREEEDSNRLGVRGIAGHPNVQPPNDGIRDGVPVAGGKDRDRGKDQQRPHPDPGAPRGHCG